MANESEVGAAASPSNGKRVTAYLLTIPLMLIVWFNLLPAILHTAIYLGLVFTGGKVDHDGHLIFVGYLLAETITIPLSIWSWRLAGRGSVAAAPLVQLLAYCVLAGLVFGANSLI